MSSMQGSRARGLERPPLQGRCRLPSLRPQPLGVFPKGLPQPLMYTHMYIGLRQQKSKHVQCWPVVLGWRDVEVDKVEAPLVHVGGANGASETTTTMQTHECTVGGNHVMIVNWVKHARDKEEVLSRVPEPKVKVEVDAN